MLRYSEDNDGFFYIEDDDTDWVVFPGRGRTLEEAYEDFYINVIKVLLRVQAVEKRLYNKEEAKKWEE